jgi:hypothetical protein
MFNYPSLRNKPRLMTKEIAYPTRWLSLFSPSIKKIILIQIHTECGSPILYISR